MRITAVEVRQIMENCTVDEQIIDAFIVGANELITNIFAGDSTVSPKLLKELEKWLTAHMLAVTIQRTAAEEEIMDARVKWTGYWGQKLLSTSYGQTVLILDYTGKMAKAGKASASMNAVKSFDE